MEDDLAEREVTDSAAGDKVTCDISASLVRCTLAGVASFSTLRGQLPKPRSPHLPAGDAGPVPDGDVMTPALAGQCPVTVTGHHLREGLAWHRFPYLSFLTEVKISKVRPAGHGHLEALVIDHGPRAPTPPLVDSHARVAQLDHHLLDDRRASGTVHAAVPAALRLVEYPGAGHVVESAVCRGVGAGSYQDHRQGQEVVAGHRGVNCREWEASPCVNMDRLAPTRWAAASLLPQI